MLNQLYIKNYAIIDEVRIDFAQDFTVITGETGAGKSIMLGAISLIMGERAEVRVLKDAAAKCVIEAEFDLSTYDFKAFFESHELDDEDPLIIRREISPKGKSRAFINDSPVSLKILSALSKQIIDLHLQFETLDIHEHWFQIELLDHMAGSTKEVDQYKRQYAQLKQSQKQLEALQSQKAEAQREYDYLLFQKNELEEAQIKIGEEESLESNLQMQEHAEEIKSSLFDFAQFMQSGDQATLDKMRDFQYQLQKLVPYHADLEQFNKRFESIYIELDELTAELNQWNESLDFDAEQTAEQRTRLDLINQLLNKHQCPNTALLVQRLADLSDQLKQNDQIDLDIASLEQEIQRLEAQMSKSCKTISQKRKKAIPSFDKEVMKRLASLKMKNAKFHVDQKAAGQWNAYGNDEIEYLFSANVGMELAAIKKVASGGELSRLSLITKSLAAERMQLPTLIFDEIDSGVSGDVAQRMAALLQQISQNHQVICITHSPQIAASGDQHLYVRKQVKNKQTATQVDLLNPEERIEKLAIMLSSDPPSQAAIANAKELLEN